MSLLAGTDNVIAMVSIKILKKIMEVGGGESLSAEVEIPSS